MNVVVSKVIWKHGETLGYGTGVIAETKQPIYWAADQRIMRTLKEKLLLRKPSNPLHFEVEARWIIPDFLWPEEKELVS